MGYYSTYGQETIADMVGKTFVEVKNVDDAELHFITEDGTKYIFHHSQDCCESVFIESVVGDLNDLVGSPLLVAEESSNAEAEAKGEYDESFTWTFYKFATIKGYVDVRWYGSSNGYYSESVNFSVVKPETA